MFLPHLGPILGVYMCEFTESSQQLDEVSTIVLILQMRKLRHREKFKKITAKQPPFPYRPEARSESEDLTSSRPSLGGGCSDPR